MGHDHGSPASSGSFPGEPLSGKWASCDPPPPPTVPSLCVERIAMAGFLDVSLPIPLKVSAQVRPLLTGHGLGNIHSVFLAPAGGGYRSHHQADPRSPNVKALSFWRSGLVISFGLPAASHPSARKDHCMCPGGGTKMTFSHSVAASHRHCLECAIPGREGRIADFTYPFTLVDGWIGDLLDPGGVPFSHHQHQLILTLGMLRLLSLPSGSEQALQQEWQHWGARRVLPWWLLATPVMIGAAKGGLDVGGSLTWQLPQAWIA